MKSTDVYEVGWGQRQGDGREAVGRWPGQPGATLLPKPPGHEAGPEGRGFRSAAQEAEAAPGLLPTSLSR